MQNSNKGTYNKKLNFCLTKTKTLISFCEGEEKSNGISN